MKQNGWVEALASMDGDVTWKSCLIGLSEASYSFVTRALVDALPTNSNLAIWKKVISSQCGSCDSKKQTLLHVLNHCSNKLQAFTWRHNNILFKLKEFISSKLPDQEILCDLVVKDKCFVDANVHTVPFDILSTNLRPDLCIIDRANQKITIVELTVPYTSNISSAQERKSLKYRPLVAGLEEMGFETTFYTIELCSRGIAAQGTSRILKSLCHSSRSETRELVKSLSRLVIKCSYIIFREKDNRDAIFKTVILS